ncbi:MAG: methylated-DNA--[protein]-cysteine S-methyltransferase [Candidatus Nanopelagicales bacterium]
MAISYVVSDTPIGPLFLASTERGIVRVAFECEDFDSVIVELEENLSDEAVEDSEVLAKAVKQFDEYFAGVRQEFELDLDHSLSSGFRRDVQEQLTNIDFGTTQSYQEVAATVGNPKAVRAVGSACATNPIPVVVPCHRVLRSDGSLGGYRGGLKIKTTLLELEQAA